MTSCNTGDTNHNWKGSTDGIDIVLENIMVGRNK
jgi:hypothetical protein